MQQKCWAILRQMETVASVLKGGGRQMRSLWSFLNSVKKSSTESGTEFQKLCCTESQVWAWGITDENWCLERNPSWQRIPWRLAHVCFLPEPGQCSSSCGPAACLLPSVASPQVQPSFSAWCFAKSWIPRIDLNFQKELCVSMWYRLVLIQRGLTCLSSSENRGAEDRGSHQWLCCCLIVLNTFYVGNF